MSAGKIVLFYGSPRKEGLTTKLLREVARGAKEKGLEVKEYDLADPAVLGCQGCFYCRGNEGCPVKDPLQPMYADIKEAGGVVFGSPIYFHEITGQAKQGLDRLFPVIDMGPAGPKPRYAGKKVVTVFAQANPDKEAFKGAMQGLHGLFGGFGWNLAESLVCAGPLTDDSPEFKQLLQQAYQAGQALA